MTEPKRCSNCETPLAGPYCHRCGQRDMSLRLAIGTLFFDFLSETFEADGRLAHTMPLFLVHPGRLVRAFVDGQRARFTSPVRLLIFAVAVSFFLVGFKGHRAIERASATLEDKVFVVEDGEMSIDFSNNGQISIDVDSTDSPLRKLEGLNQRLVAEMLFDQWLDLAPTFALCLVPLFAVFLELLYPRFLVVEHLLLSVLLHAQGLLLWGVAVAIGRADLLVVVSLLLMVQLYRGQRAVYGQSWARTAWKWALLVGGYLVALLTAMVGVLVWMAV